MIKEEVIKYVYRMIEEHGHGHIVTTSEIVNYIHINHGVNESSIIPSDYCYNRFNSGITDKSPAVFEYLKPGTYKCLGENYPYNGTIYHKPKGSYEIAVGKCINGIRFIAPDEKESIKEGQSTNKSRIQRKTPRDPSLSLRFSVLQRDNFRCCACGASPAKDPNVELHIDHVIAWSKGGETELSNLQTLCSKCNIGKGDR